MNLEAIKKELRKTADSERAKALQRFFKTGKGEYGEGDKFIGLKVPDIRKVAKKYKDINIPEILKLLASKFHEERMLALVIMTLRYPKEKDTFFNLYIENTKYINNWDLVDVTCPRIVGDYLLDKPSQIVIPAKAGIQNSTLALSLLKSSETQYNNHSRDILYKFAVSNDLWKKRIAIISTFAFIDKDDFEDALKISAILLDDSHDLIHKAVGWTLREVGNKSKKTEVDFLNKYYKTMPRTMLRYAIEKFPEKERKMYLNGDI